MWRNVISKQVLLYLRLYPQFPTCLSISPGITWYDAGRWTCLLHPPPFYQIRRHEAWKSPPWLKTTDSFHYTGTAVRCWSVGRNIPTDCRPTSPSIIIWNSPPSPAGLPPGRNLPLSWTPAPLQSVDITVNTLIIVKCYVWSLKTISQCDTIKIN